MSPPPGFEAVEVREDDAGHRYLLLLNPGGGIVRVEKRSSDGDLLLATEFSTRGVWQFYMAVAPTSGQIAVSAWPIPCRDRDPPCPESWVEFGGERFSSPAVVKLDACGRFLWARGLDGQQDYFPSIDEHGDVLLDAEAGPDSPPPWIEKLRADGTRAWRIVGNGYSTAALDRDGNTILAGCDYIFPTTPAEGIPCAVGTPWGGLRTTIAKLDRDGGVLWSLSVSAVWKLGRVATASDGTIVVIGHNTGAGGTAVGLYMAVAVSSSGTLLWARSFGSPNVMAYERWMLFPLAVEPGGRALVAAYVSERGTPAPHLVLLKIDRDGGITGQWDLRQYGSAWAAAYGTDLQPVLSVDGRVVNLSAE